MRKISWAFLLLCVPLCGQEEVTCCNTARPYRFYVRHLEMKGIGFNDGYTTFGLFFSNPNPWLGNVVGFYDVRAHVINNGKPALNTGIGFRALFGDTPQYAGMNLYYDYRKSRLNYNQLALGLEYLCGSWEMRANGYLPVGRKVTPHFDLEFDEFTGHSVRVKRKKQFAMPGAEGEIGWRSKQWGIVDLYAAVGPYYYRGHFGDNAFGGKARLALQVGPYMTFDVQDSYDKVFHNRFTGQLTLSIPFGQRSKTPDGCCERWGRVLDRAHEIPDRNEMIVLDTKTKSSIAIDPGTGLPFFLWFVDNTSSSLGTFESPYNNLAQASAASGPGDIIYVFPGDGTTNGMAAGIVLKSGQKLWGSAAKQNLPTTLGTVTVPALTNVFPAVTNGMAIVTLDVNNEVSGLNLIGGTTGISGTFTGTTSSLSIHNNLIAETAGVTGNQIELTALAGATLNVDIHDNSLLYSFGDPILITATGPAAFVESTISSNFVSNTSTKPPGPFMGGAVGVHLLTDNDSVQSSNIFDNQFYGNTEFPLVVFDAVVVEEMPTSNPASRTIVRVSNNQIAGSSGQVILVGRPASSGSIEATIVGNHWQSVIPSSIIYNTVGACSVFHNGTGTISGSILGNEFQSVGVGLPLSPFAGVEVNALLGSNVQLLIEGNDFFECRGFGGARIACDGTGDFLIRNNTFVNCGDILFGGAGVVSLSTTGNNKIKILRNSFEDNPNKDVNINFTGGSACLRIQENRAPIGYAVQNTGGTVFIEPVLGNTGGFFPIGPMIPVPDGSCN